MESETVAGLLALVWLIAAFLSMMRSVQRGRELAEALAIRHQEAYEALGRPRPGYLQSLRRDRFARFVAKREFEDLGDPALAADFEAHRKTEARLLAGLIATAVAVVLVGLSLTSGES